MWWSKSCLVPKTGGLTVEAEVAVEQKKTTVCRITPFRTPTRLTNTTASENKNNQASQMRLFNFLFCHVV